MPSKKKGFSEPLLGDEATPKEKRENRKVKLTIDEGEENVHFQRKPTTSASSSLWSRLCVHNWTNGSRFRFLLVFVLFVIIYVVYTFTSYGSYKHVEQRHFTTFRADVHKYLIYSDTCKLKDWPVFDDETRPIFVNVSSKTRFCTRKKYNIEIARHNYTWVKIHVPGYKDLGGWRCWARELVRVKSNDRWDYGPDGFVGPLGMLYNFDRDLMSTRTKHPQQTWDSVQVFCNKSILNSKPFEHYYSVALIQKYYPSETLTTAADDDSSATTTAAKTTHNKTNVLLLGIDSISRLNFLRHFIRTKAFVEEKGFIPLYGYHKVGENSFPNIFPMMTGRQVDEYWNSKTPNDFRFDSTPLIFYDFNKNGYLTTFVEDMARFGFFTYGKPGFREQPTHYYPRPFNFAIYNDLYSSYSCYFKKLECEIYYDYIFDLLKAMRDRGNQPHFIFNQASTLTHDYFNHAGYADRPYASLLKRIFDNDFHKNTVIFLYSDHGLRFGDILRTQSGIYEQRLPFFYMYIPDELVVDGKDARKLRNMLLVNQRRLTSHIDLHATMMHLIYGHEPTKEPYGRSLFTEIPLNRTCKQAGILDHYCMCNAYIRLRYREAHDRISKVVVGLINERVAGHQDLCVELKFNETLSTLTPQNEIKLTKDHHYLVQFKTQPNKGIYESTVLVTGDIHNTKEKIKVTVIGDISRLDKYGHQTKCVFGLNKIERFCYCRNLLPTTTTTTSTTTTTTTTTTAAPSTTENSNLVASIATTAEG